MLASLLARISSESFNKFTACNEINYYGVTGDISGHLGHKKQLVLKMRVEGYLKMVPSANINRIIGLARCNNWCTSCIHH